MLTTHTRANQKLKKGDLVRVISGKEKGKTAKIMKILSKHERAILEGLNMIKRHQKPTAQNQQGGIVQKEAPIHLSNLVAVESASKPAKAKAPAKTAKKKSKEA